MQKSLTDEQADALQYVLSQRKEIISAKVYERTADVVVQYHGKRQDMVRMLQELALDNLSVPQSVTELSGRATNREYQDKLAEKIMLRMGSKLFLPYPVRCVIAAVKSVKYIWKGLQCALSRRIEVPLLDGIAIGVSILRGDMDTAGSVMFLLDIGEILEIWTHKKSVDDLARSMSLNISKVWMLSDGQEVQVDPDNIVAGDMIVVHMGNMIPFDGIVIRGEGMVNQSSLTGESMPVEKKNGGYVYAGTVLEEGELVVQVKVTSGSTRYEKIITMIEGTEKLKSGMESKAEHLADRLVLYTLLGTGAVYLLTANPTKALAVLMVDFSCALKLAMPITVLAAMKEDGRHHTTVKGGKFMEQLAEADTIVFDKTGTLTEGKLSVERVSSDIDEREFEKLMSTYIKYTEDNNSTFIALRNRFKGSDKYNCISSVPFSSERKYSSVTLDNGQTLVIGAPEKLCKTVPYEAADLMADGKRVIFAGLCSGEINPQSIEVIGMIVISDKVRKNAHKTIQYFYSQGIDVKVISGDNAYSASAVAEKAGIKNAGLYVDMSEVMDADIENAAQRYKVFGRVTPKQKKLLIAAMQKKGHKVAMTGDGVNDLLAMRQADCSAEVANKSFL